ncbi:hypothetical protein ANACOL_00773 [Anaerotruncus colihominis DSM 17241]|uniref:Uncharacterized protein n=1 Tax=Anaerotruncus colihominis DSM 17241 TaxID=445972 RepID=B0P7N7_9FIRM|nr:hypothetical protein ANACOL_00773 [Anaerotruncus colihominis DSM 17241]
MVFIANNPPRGYLKIQNSRLFLQTAANAACEKSGNISIFKQA